MYTTCMVCKKPLGSNEVVEEFPVGRRLAFDAAKGRLWVVCRSCERWNLSPLEERWEAVETCERLFRATRVRTSSENIGLAKHREGLELVRIGKPLRPEFAAWRYGNQFGRRRNRMLLLGSVAGLATAGGIVAGGMLIGLSGGSFVFNVAQLLYNVSIARARIRFRTSDGQLRSLKRVDVLMATRIEPADDEVGFRLQTQTGVWMSGHREWLEGEDARRALAAIIPCYNVMGGRKRTVRAAVSEIESLGHPRRFLLDVVGRLTTLACVKPARRTAAKRSTTPPETAVTRPSRANSPASWSPASRTARSERRPVTLRRWRRSWRAPPFILPHTPRRPPIIDSGRSHGPEGTPKL